MIKWLVICPALVIHQCQPLKKTFFFHWRGVIHFQFMLEDQTVRFGVIKCLKENVRCKRQFLDFTSNVPSHKAIIVNVFLKVNSQNKLKVALKTVSKMCMGDSVNGLSLCVPLDYYVTRV